MCGILGLLCHSNDKGMKGLVQKYYLKQSRQGSEGFGLLIKKRDGRIYRRRTETSKEIFKDKIWNRVKAGDLLVFHHRNPTSTPNLPECNHPLTNEDKSIYLAHIGIILDYGRSYRLEREHYFESEIEEITKTRKRNYIYRSYTDSEIALHRLEEILEKTDRVTAMKRLCEEFYGSVFLVIFRDEHRIYLCSNGGHNLWSYEDYFASSTLWKNARLIQYKYGYFDGKLRELVTKDIKPTKSIKSIITSTRISCTYNKEEEEEFFYESDLSEFLQSRSQSCGMGISYDSCDNCPLREDCEEEFIMFYYGF